MGKRKGKIKETAIAGFREKPKSILPTDRRPEVTGYKALFSSLYRNSGTIDHKQRRMQKRGRCKKRCEKREWNGKREGVPPVCKNILKLFVHGSKKVWGGTEHSMDGGD